MSLVGTWNVVSSPDFDDDYLRMDGEPYVRLEQKGRFISGGYHIGLQTGIIDGRSKEDNQMPFALKATMRWSL